MTDDKTKQWEADGIIRAETLGHFLAGLFDDREPGRLLLHRQCWGKSRERCEAAAPLIERAIRILYGHEEEQP